MSAGKPHRRKNASVTCRSPTRQWQRRASDVQRALLPPPVYANGLVEAAAMMQTRWAVGGDFYDYVDMGQEFRVMLGDACGSGTAAALQAAVVQGILAIEPKKDGGPALVLSQLNTALCRRRIPARFVTLFYGVLTPEHRLTYCNAGHCRPLLVNRHRVYRLGTGGPPLGLWCEARFEEASLDIHPGDILAACSDGLLEAVGGYGVSREEFGDGRFLHAVWRHRDRSASEIVQRLVASVREFTAGEGSHDDMTTLIVRYLGEASGSPGVHPGNGQKISAGGRPYSP